MEYAKSNIDFVLMKNITSYQRNLKKHAPNTLQYGKKVNVFENTTFSCLRSPNELETVDLKSFHFKLNFSDIF